MLKVYTRKEGCKFCDDLKELLDKSSHEVEYIDVGGDGVRDFLISKGHRSVPIVYEDDTFIGYFDAAVKKLELK